MPEQVLCFSFNGVSLSEPCHYCNGDGEIPPTEKPKCPHCQAEVEPFETDEADAKKHTSWATSDYYLEWWSRNPWRCPKCGEFGNGPDWGIEPNWCCECEGSGRQLTNAGMELLVFLDAFRPRKES